jgi:hypothetical protein
MSNSRSSTDCAERRRDQPQGRLVSETTACDWRTWCTCLSRIVALLEPPRSGPLRSSPSPPPSAAARCASLWEDAAVLRQQVAETVARLADVVQRRRELVGRGARRAALLNGRHEALKHPAHARRVLAAEQCSDGLPARQRALSAAPQPARREQCSHALGACGQRQHWQERRRGRTASGARGPVCRWRARGSSRRTRTSPNASSSDCGRDPRS